MDPLAISVEEARSMPILSPKEVIERFGAAGQRPASVLIEESDFVEMLQGVGGFDVNHRTLSSYSSGKIGLMPQPIKRDGKVCYVFPEHFDRLGIILTLRQAYNLPLTAIQNLLEHFPKENQELLLERKLEIGDLLDLAKMLKGGFQLKDLIMAKASDLLLQDLISSSAALSAAVEPGDTLRKLQERMLLARLDEMKAWVTDIRISNRSFGMLDACHDQWAVQRSWSNVAFAPLSC